MYHQTGLPRAARLFDEVFGHEKQLNQPRRPLRSLSQNSNRSRVRNQRRPAAKTSDPDFVDSLEGQDTPSPLFSDSPRPPKGRKKKNKAVVFQDSYVHEGKKKEKKEKKENHRTASRKYPECTKDALLVAYEKANLPDFDIIARHELNITIERPGRRRGGTPGVTPPLNQLLQVFEETDFTMEKSRVPSPRQESWHEQQVVSSYPLPLNDSSQRRVEVCLAEPISLRAPRRRRQHATLIQPILLSPESGPSLRRSQRKSSLVSHSTSSTSPTIRENYHPCIGEERKGSSNASTIDLEAGMRSSKSQNECGSQSIVPDNTFILPLIPNSPLGAGRRTFVEPNTLRSEDFGLSFGAGMTSTPLTNANRRPFLKPNRTLLNSRPFLQSASMNCSSIASTTGKAYRPSVSLIRSQLQSAGKLHRTITCQSLRLSETVIPNRRQLRETLISSFATAFSTAKLIIETGEEKILTYRDKVLSLCSPPQISPFDAVFTPDLLESIKKIGEGSYGEIYMTKSPEGLELVWKLVPFSRHEEEEDIFRQILPEVVICSTFNRLCDSSVNRSNNFIRMTRAACLRGAFPAKLIEEWDEFDRLRQSENPDPRDYPADNLHLLMILNNGGTDLEHCKLKSGCEALAIFLQAAFSLAAAEAEFEFEHRDLHWGNILVKPTVQQTAQYMVSGCTYEIPIEGTEVSIIDFTLSRISKDGYTVYDDLSKYTDLFEGDAQIDYQFEIYRKMQDANGNDWEHYCPKSNIYWLEYLLDKLLHHKKYSSRSKNHLKANELMRKFRKNILNFESSIDFIESSCKTYLSPASR